MWAIVKQLTGEWCHWFRSQRISYLVNKLRSAEIAGKLVGIKAPATISGYYKTQWRQHKEELK